MLAKEYRWTPQQVLQLTLYQLRVYLSDESLLGGTVKGDVSTSLAMSMTIKENRRRMSDAVFEAVEERMGFDEAG